MPDTAKREEKMRRRRIKPVYPVGDGPRLWIALSLMVVVLISIVPAICHSDTVPVGTAAADGMYDTKELALNDYRIQIEMLVEKVRELEETIVSLLQSITDNNDYLKFELAKASHEKAEVIRNVILMIATERQEIENVIASQRELKEMFNIHKVLLEEKIDSVESDDRLLAETVRDEKVVENARDTEEAVQAKEVQRDENAKGNLPEEVKENPASTSRVATGMILLFAFILLVPIFLIFKSHGSIRFRGDGVSEYSPASGHTGSGTDTHDAGKHALPVVMSEAIYRIRMMMDEMDKTVHRLGSLNYQISRMENEIAERGYSVTDLTGQHYSDDQEMKVVNVIEREDLAPGEMIILRMFKPRISYKDRVVSHGTVELAASSDMVNSLHGGNGNRKNEEQFL